MAKYRCPMCGWIYDEEAEGAPFSTLKACLLCGAPASEFYLVEEDEDRGALEEIDAVTGQRTEKTGKAVPSTDVAVDSARSLAVSAELRRTDALIRHMDTIHTLAEQGSVPDGAMATSVALPSWDELLVLGAQLDPMPLDEGAPVDISCVVGPKAERPLVLDGPVFVSHMSFGALSREAKIALARGKNVRDKKDAIRERDMNRDARRQLREINSY